MQCAKCEAELGPDARFCTGCGTPAPVVVSSAPQQRSQKAGARNNSTRNAILLLAITFCGFGATGYWAYVQFGAPAPEATLTQADALPAELPLEAPTEAERAGVVELTSPPDPGSADPVQIEPVLLDPAPAAAPIAPPTEPKRAAPVAPPAPEPLPVVPAKAPPAVPEPAVAAESKPPEPEVPPRPPRGRSSILMPGAGAYAGSASPPPGTARSKDPGAPVPIASRFPERPTAPPPPKTEGDVYWTGQLKKGETIVVGEDIAAAGYVDGDYFPGEPIEVVVPSPAVRIVERPGPDNGWKKLVLECLRSTKGTATINVQWRLAAR